MKNSALLFLLCFSSLSYGQGNSTTFCTGHPSFIPNGDGKVYRNSGYDDITHLRIGDTIKIESTLRDGSPSASSMVRVFGNGSVERMSRPGRGPFCAIKLRNERSRAEIKATEVTLTSVCLSPSLEPVYAESAPYNVINMEPRLYWRFEVDHPDIYEISCSSIDGTIVDFNKVFSGKMSLSLRTGNEREISDSSAVNQSDRSINLERPAGVQPANEVNRPNQTQR